MKKNKTINIKLKSLEAFLLSKEKGAEEGISALGKSSEPDLIRRKLSILLDSEQFGEAVSLINDLPLHERWCDKAISAYVRNGNIAKAKETIEWTKTIDDEPLRNRCRLFYADSCYAKALQNRKEGDVILPGTLSDKEKEELTDILNILEPILAKVSAEKKVFQEIESLALQIAIRINYLFCDIQKIRNLSNLLLSREPIPLEVGRLALNRLITIPSNVPERFRKEHSDSFEAQLLASLLESEVFGQHGNAFENIKKSTYMAQNEEQKIGLCKVLYQISLCLGKKELNEVKDICIGYFGEDHRLVSLIQADIFVREKELDKAYEYLMKAKDENDPAWLQIYAEYLHLSGKQPEALEYMNRACSILPHPELLKATAKLAFEMKRYDRSIELLTQELTSEPDNISLLNNIAAAYFRKGDYESAAKYYEKLKGIRPEELSYLLNLATCYAQIGNSQKAIEAYDDVCKRNDAPLEVFLSRAFLIRINDPVDAFKSILPLKDKYWENPQYLQVVLDLSYRAGKEEYGHQAMLKLMELQRQGKAPQEILQAKTIEDLKSHMNEWNKRVEYINKNILTGKLPWLMSDHWQNHTAYMGWYLRTQPLPWRIEEPLNCASFSIYSTNSFSVIKLSNDTTRLDFIECPAKDTDIVIDLSAIITLHRLSLLEISLNYFSKRFVPQEYPAKLLKDSDNLVIHQLTRKTSAETIKRAIDNGQIIILEDVGSVGDKPFPFVHEHTLPEKEKEHYYRLIDMIQVAYDTGRLNEEKYNALKKIAHKPSGINPEHPGLKHGQSILVDILTLYSISQIDIKSLGPILNTFKIHISKEDQIRNSGEIIQIETQEQLKLWNYQLLQLIRDKDEFIKEHPNSVPELKEDNVYVASCWVAKEKSLPLLADDRVLQVLAINENKSIEYPSFGTDRLLLKLFEENLIDIETLSNAFLTLMKWRYRFIVPTKDVLIALAKRYKKHPPGQDLQDTALYLHDCMRDPGLFGGPENTTLKESMAVKLCVTWTRIIAEFLVGVWADLEFNEESAKNITEWTLKEFCPSLPKNMIHNLSKLEMLPKLILDNFLVQTFNIKDASRTNKALQIIAEGLNMDETQYFKAVSEVIDIYEV
jgi:tetratricopeptide (TPR) repeat protein